MDRYIAIRNYGLRLVAILACLACLAFVGSLSAWGQAHLTRSTSFQVPTMNNLGVSCAKPTSLLKTTTFTDISKSFDIYGGNTQRKCPGSATSYWRIAQTTDATGKSVYRYCTPDYNDQKFEVGLFNLNIVWEDQPTVTAKYGDLHPHGNVQENRRAMLLGFNSLNQYAGSFHAPAYSDKSYKGITADGTIPVKIPTVAFFRPGWYSLCDGHPGCGAFTASPLLGGSQTKDIYQSMNRKIWTFYAGWNFADPVDPLLQTMAISYFTKTSDGKAQLAQPKYLYGISMDDGDNKAGFGGACDNFPPYLNGKVASTGYCQPHLGVAALVTPARIYAHYDSQHNTGLYIYADPEVKTKAFAQQILVAEYNNNIASLNAAWNSRYTSFGSDSARMFGFNIKTVASFSLPYQHVDAASVIIYQDGHAVATDDANGKIAGAGISGTIDYVKGLVTTNLPSAGHSYSVDFSYGGRGYGHGLLDEDGTSAWITKNHLKFTGSTAQFKADVDNLLYQVVKAHTQMLRNVADAVAPGVPFLGPTTYAYTKGTPARAQVYQALCSKGANGKPLIDVLPLGSVYVPQAPDLQQRMQFVSSSCGRSIPMQVWEAELANSDSDEPAATQQAQRATDTNQQARGNSYYQMMQWYLTFKLNNGSNPFLAVDMWTWTDSYQGNYGMITEKGNLYNGVEAVKGSTQDIFGCAAGEEAGNYGDSIDTIRLANYLWLNY